MQVAHAALSDARAVAEIHVRSWQSAYAGILPADYLAALSIEKREAWWAECIAAGAPELLVARDQGSVLGWLNFGACRDEDSPAGNAEIWALYVSPTAWSAGIGRALWQRAQERMLEQGFASCGLWAFPQNARAIRFYEAAGFVLDTASAKRFEIAGRMLQEVRYARPLQRVRDT